jgi:uncharacterized protein (DUF1684 family)
LKYFSENEALRFEIVLEEFTEIESVEIQTSTGDIRVYDRFGRIKFQVDGK